MLNSLLQIKTKLAVAKALEVGAYLSTQIKPLVKDLTDPALMDSLDPEVAKAMNTCINVYSGALSLDKNEHVFVQYCAKGALLAPAHSPLKVLCTVGFSTGWLLADSKTKALAKRIALSGGLALAFSAKLALPTKQNKYPLAA